MHKLSYEHGKLLDQSLFDAQRAVNEVSWQADAGRRNLRPTQVIKTALHIGREVTKDDVMLEEAYTMNEQFNAQSKPQTTSNFNGLCY